MSDDGELERLRARWAELCAEMELVRARLCELSPPQPQPQPAARSIFTRETIERRLSQLDASNPSHAEEIAYLAALKRRKGWD